MSDHDHGSHENHEKGGTHAKEGAVAGLAFMAVIAPGSLAAAWRSFFG